MLKLFSLALALALGLSSPMAGAASPPDKSTAKTAAKPGAVRELKWEELVPPGWDPSKILRSKGDLSRLQDGDPKTSSLMREVREVWDNAPIRPELAGKKVKLPGYLVPLEGQSGEWKEFLVVPYFGACVHSPPPPANQIVHVLLDKPVKRFRSMDTVWITGALSGTKTDSHMGVAGYRMDAKSVTPYSEKK